MDLASKNILFSVTALLLVSSSLIAQETTEQEPSAPPADQLVPVADEDYDSGDDAAAPVLGDEAQLIEQFARYKQLLSDGVYDEADAVAKRVVELAIRVYGPTSNDTAKALTNLAIVQHRTNQFDAAQQNYAAAIDIIENNEDQLNGQLINPLKGLGASQLEGGRPDLATQTFNRAVHVTHVNEGPHNLEQIDILESLAETNLRLGTIEEAKAVQDTIYALNVRHHDGNEIELVPSLMRRAAWQHRAGFIFDERSTYRRVIRIIEEHAGKDDLQLVDPLTRLGQSFFYVDLSGAQSYQPATMTTGEVYFKRAARIAKENPESEWKIVAGTQLALGDYYMFQSNEQRARKVYKDAWELLSEDESRHDYRRQALEELVTLRERPFPQFVSESGSDTNVEAGESVLQGKITLTYTISARGRAASLKVVEADPPEFEEMLRSVQREMRRRIYRPYFVDGDPVTSSELILTHRYHYRQSDLEALQDQTVTAEQGEET